MEGREVSYNNKDAEARSESPEVVLFQRRCCFCFPCFGSANRGGLRLWHKQNQHQLGGEVDERSLLSRGISALKKLREWSEIVAGPRWKTFIRRFNRSKSGSGGRQGKFQYDPLDYSLNFDQGPGNLEEETEYAYRNFSVRYASIPASAKASMDLGKDGPSFV
nr:Protein tincar like [Ipomoea batatas]